MRQSLEEFQLTEFVKLQRSEDSVILFIWMTPLILYKESLEIFGTDCGYKY